MPLDPIVSPGYSRGTLGLLRDFPEGDRMEQPTNWNTAQPGRSMFNVEEQCANSGGFHCHAWRIWHPEVGSAGPCSDVGSLGKNWGRTDQQYRGNGYVSYAPNETHSTVSDVLDT